EGQVEEEGAAGAFDALEADAAAVQVDDALHDGEAEPGPRRTVGGVALHPIELVEDVRQVGRRNAASGVVDGDGGRVGLLGDGDGNADAAAGGRVLDRVADQVQQRLAQARGRHR